MKRKVYQYLTIGIIILIFSISIILAVNLSNTSNNDTQEEIIAYQASIEETLEYQTVLEVITTIETEPAATEIETIATEVETTIEVDEESSEVKETEPEIQKQTSMESATEVAVEVNPDDLITNVRYSNGINIYTYATLTELKANVSITTIEDEVAAATAVTNLSIYSDMISTMTALVNEYRAINSLPALIYDENLSKAAGHRAVESAFSDWNVTGYENGSLHHYRPNFQPASSIAYLYNIYGNFGENYARYFSTCADAMEGWKASPSHNSLLLSNKYSRLGVGIAQDKDDYYYYILLFN